LEAGALDNFLLDLLAAEKIIPPIKVNGINNEHRVLRIRQGAGFTVAGLLTDAKDVGKTVTFMLPEPGYIYCLGSGYAGNGAELKIKLKSPLIIFTVFDRVQSKPQITLSASDLPLRPVKADLGKLNNGVVLLIQVKNPEGKILKLRNQVIITSDTEKSALIRFAYNDAPGAYQIIFTDVATGLSSLKTVILKNSSN
jgi:hypothetical protein